MSGIAVYSIKQHQAYKQLCHQVLPYDPLIDAHDYSLDKKGCVHSFLTKLADACLYLIGLLCCKKTHKTRNNEKVIEKETRIPPREQSTISIDLSSVPQIEDLQNPDLLSPKSDASSKYEAGYKYYLGLPTDNRKECQQETRIPDLLSPKSDASSKYEADVDPDVDLETRTYEDD